MPATFRVANTLSLSTKNIFVLTGNLLSGEIEGGMSINVDFDDLRIKIDTIEHVRSGNHEEILGLTFKNMNTQELDFLKALTKNDIIVASR